MSYRAAAIHLDKLHRDGFLSEHAWEVLRPELQAQAQNLALAAREMLRANPALAEEELDRARRELSRARRSALLGLQRDGVISEEVLEALIQELELEAPMDAEDAAGPRPENLE
jgi:hypothetical protein